MRCCTRINIYTQFSIIFCEIAEEHNLCLYGFMLKLKHRLKKKLLFFINLFVANLHIFPLHILVQFPLKFRKYMHNEIKLQHNMYKIDHRRQIIIWSYKTDKGRQKLIRTKSSGFQSKLVECWMVLRSYIKVLQGQTWWKPSQCLLSKVAKTSVWVYTDDIW